MHTKPNVTIVLLVALLLTMTAFNVVAYAQQSSMATLTGRVTYNGSYQDNATVALVGGGSDTTKNGGYYTLNVVPNIAVTMKASYGDQVQTKTIDAGIAGSVTTVNFDLAVPPTQTPATVVLGPKTVTLLGTVKYRGDPLMGIPVNVSPVTTVNTDSAGHYQAMVPAGLYVTISAVTAVGSATKIIMTPAAGENVVVDLTLDESGAGAGAGAGAGIATPTSVATPEATTDDAVNITATPVSTPVIVSPEPTVTSVPPTPTAAPAGSESLAIISVFSMMAVIVLTKLKKE